MCWNASRPGLRFLSLIACLAAGDPLYAAASTAPEPDGYEAFLVTYGPGEVYWQRFGHNAIWLREPARGLDHSFNFGFFDFEQENFLLRFVQGRMLYFAAAGPAAREQEIYRSEGRSVRLQKLDLDSQQYARLRDHLTWHVQPENRDYLYDYYLDNCSTRLRDALDFAIDGALGEQFRPQAGLQTFRAHTRRSTAADFWYYLGLELALGAPVDRDISRWDEMFLPAMLADSLAEVAVLEPGRLRPLVNADELQVASQVPLPPAVVEEVWPRYVGLSLGLLALGWLLARLAPPVLIEGFMQAWMLNAGVLGLMMVMVWLWTDHAAAHPNANLLLMNPIMLLALVPALRKPVAVVTAIGLFGALVVLAIPWWQYTRDVAALLIPLHAASAYRLWSCDPPNSSV